MYSRKGRPRKAGPEEKKGRHHGLRKRFFRWSLFVRSLLRALRLLRRRVHQLPHGQLRVVGPGAPAHRPELRRLHQVAELLDWQLLHAQEQVAGICLFGARRAKLSAGTIAFVVASTEVSVMQLVAVPRDALGLYDEVFAEEAPDERFMRLLERLVRRGELQFTNQEQRIE